MGSTGFTCVVFMCAFSGALAGMFLRAALGESHLTPDSKDLVKLGMGLIATMTALVLGLLVASAKGSYDAQKNELSQMSANIILLDRTLARYGPETKEARELLRRSVSAKLERTWPEKGSTPRYVDPSAESEAIYAKIQELEPKTETQRALQTQAIKSNNDLAQTRWLLFAKRSSAIPVPFLVVVTFWLTMLFIGYGLLAPRKMIVIVTLVLCAMSVSGAIFLILDLDRPFEGFIQISSEPLRNAFEQLGR